MLLRYTYHILFIFCVFLPLSAASQTSLKEISVQYNDNYQLGRSYTILYDNKIEPVKINAFKINFYQDGNFIAATETESYPQDAQIAVYELMRPVTGFNSIKLDIISLYSGQISDFSSGASLLALNEDNKVTDNKVDDNKAAGSPPPPVNRPLQARRASFEIEAGAEGAFSLNSYYSNSDGKTPAVLVFSGQVSGLSYNLKANGTLSIRAPDVIGTYEIPYEVTDGSGASAKGIVTITSTLPAALGAALLEQKNQLGSAEARLNALQISLEARERNNVKYEAEAGNLLAANQALSEQARGRRNLAVKTDINKLSQEISQSLGAFGAEGQNSELTALEVRLQTLGEKLTTIEHAKQIEDIAHQLDEVSQQMAQINAAANALDNQGALTEDRLQTWQIRHQTLAAQVKPAKASPLIWLLVISVGVIGVGAALLKLRGLKPFNSKVKTDLKIKDPIASQAVRAMTKAELIKANRLFANNLPPSKQGLIDKKAAMAFAGSSSAACRLNSAAAQASIQSSGGALASDTEKPSYRSVGRIGQAWGTTPLKDDFSLGTGLLISSRYVITNWHVYDFYGKYLQAGHLQDIGYDIACWGIEFMAYAENADQPEKAVYAAFDGNPPKIIEGLDLVVYTLAEPINEAIKARMALNIGPLDDAVLGGREIELIGHPDPTDFPSGDNRETDLKVFGKDPVFAVKRVSYGEILGPDSFNDYDGGETPLIYNHSVLGPIEVICHDASTLGGGSGSPLLDKQTGELLGIHFKCAPDFHGKKVNLAMPVSTVFRAIEDFLSKA